jgi:hypothetical protein
MNGEWIRRKMEAVVVYLRAISWDFPGGSGEKHERISR